METVRQRHLPHWDVSEAIYFVTTCLAGSIPAQGLLEIDRYRANLTKLPRPTELTVSAWKSRCWKSIFARSENWLDHRPAVRHLANPSLAEIMADSIYHFAGQRFDLLAYVIMPSHLHLAFRPHPVGQVSQPVINKNDKLETRPMKVTGWETCPTYRSPREKIMHSIKLYSARRCNEQLGRKGAFWQDESFDHCVRDVEELERILQYIEQNPVKAGLANTPEEWRFSSALDRIQQNTEFGSPLIRP